MLYLARFKFPREKMTGCPWDLALDGQGKEQASKK